MSCLQTRQFYFVQECPHIGFAQREDTGVGIKVAVVAACVAKGDMKIERGCLQEIFNGFGP